MELFRTLHHLDKDITLAINSFNCPASDWIWGVFSDKEIWFILYAAVLFFFFRNLGWKKALVVTVSCILCVVACDQGGNLCKDFFQRLRPCHDGEMIERGLHMLEGAGDLYGFYSAHAANSMGFAMCSSLGFRNDKTRSYRSYTILIFVWAILVGLSRVFVGRHFFGDVCAGFIVGILLGWMLGAIAGNICKRTERIDSPLI